MSHEEQGEGQLDHVPSPENESARDGETARLSQEHEDALAFEDGTALGELHVGASAATRPR